MLLQPTCLNVFCCCLPVPVPTVTLATEFTPVEGGEPLSPEEAKMLTLLTINWPGHAFVDCLRGRPSAPIPFATGTGADFGLLWTGGNGAAPPLITQVPMSHAFKAGWVIGK
jgi:hypothetical protein